jgi:hypothetical protein
MIKKVLPLTRVCQNGGDSAIFELWCFFETFVVYSAFVLSNPPLLQA